MKIARAYLALCLLTAWPGMSLAAHAQKQQTVTPALDGLFEAFKDYPLVGMGDAHGLAQQQDVYTAIVRDPRFAREVGNVVVEFGGAAHQTTIDRYVNGEDVPYAELRKVWEDTVGWAPYPGYAGFLYFYAQVRATNLSLPAAQRIKIWLGEPVIDWSTVTSSEQLRPYLLDRDRHAASVILDKVLAQGRKALVIYGTAHLARERPNVDGLRTSPLPGSEAKARRLLSGGREGNIDTTISTPTYSKALSPAVLAAFQKDLIAWGTLQSISFRRPEHYLNGDVFDIVFSKEKRILTLYFDADGLIEGSFFVEPNHPQMLVDLVEARRPESFYIVTPYTGFYGRPCEERFESVMNVWPKPALVTGMMESELTAKATAAGCKLDGRIAYADAMLFVGPGRDLLTAGYEPTALLDSAFREEMSRRYKIMTGAPLPPVNTENTPVTLKGFRRP